MKKIYTSALAMALLCGTAYGQQLPNADFEGAWSTCQPWTGGEGAYAIGQNPANWCISHVMGITKKETVIFVPVAAGTGAKAMGENVAGYNGSNSAVKMTNGETGAMGINRVVPGYLTLGTTWSTAQGTKTATHDGGTWGGVDFSNRPDGFEFMYKREYASADATSEEASFIMYLWKGSASQASVPVTITASASPVKKTMDNRDRNILYKDEATTTGGAITYSDDFELIAKAIITEAGAVSDWTKKTVELEYLSTSAPSMANLIFAANNYFSTAEATNGNSLTVDDVRLLYYSRLASVKVNGVELDGFDSNTFEYNLTETEYPGEGAVEVATLGNSGSAISSISYDEENYRVVITVTNTNVGGTDVDGEATHTYTIQFAAPKATGLTFRRKYTDSSSRYLNEISYIVGEETKTAYYTANPLNEAYYVTPTSSWQEEGAYIDFKDKVIEIPADAENFTMVLKGLSGSAINWSQTCVYVDWNANGSYIDEGETNGVIDRDVKPNNGIVSEEGNRDVITLPEGLNEGDTFSMLICLNEPKGVDGSGDYWSKQWEWSKLMFADGVCTLINGEAYELTVKIVKPAVTMSVLTIEQPEHATISVMNGETAVNSGDEVAAGTELTLSINVEDGYEFASYTLNGEAIEGNTFTMPEEACKISAQVNEIPVPALTFRRKYSDESKRYYNEISYLVGDDTEIQTAYYTADPSAEDYFVAPIKNQWQEEGAYVDFKDKVIEIPEGTENFTMILKGLSGSAINWSQSCVYVDWNANGSYIDAGETNGVINRDIKPNQAGGGMVMTETGDRDIIALPAEAKEGDTYSMLICLTEPKGVDGTGDLWGKQWEWSTEIFNNNVCSLINGQAYELTVKIVKPAAVKSALTITQPENAVITVMNGDDEVASGDLIAAGTELTLSAKVEAGYALSQFTLNGQPIEGNTFTMPEEAATISADVAAVDYCEATGTTPNPNKRGISQITVNGTAISGPGTSSNRVIFADHTDTEIVVKPGETVSLTANGSHSWMMGFIYVDYDNNGWNVDPEQIGLNGDLVWYEQMIPVSQLKISDATTYDMEGNAITGDARNCEISATKDLEASFVIPENLAAGTYRARFKIDWASNEPCGSSVQGQSLSANAGTMIDFTFRVEAAEEVTGRNVTVAVAEGQDALGSVAIEGSDDLTVTTEDDVVVTATAADGAQFLGWYNGEDLVSTEASYTVEGTEDVTLTANFGWTVTFTATNGTLSVMNGDTELTSGDAVRPGTVLTVTPTPNTNMEFESLTVNGNDVELTEGVATVTVNGVTEIEASFKAVMVTYTQSCTGNGKVEAWTKYDTNNDDAPAGDLIPDGSEVAMGSAINIYMIPGSYGNNQRETFAAILITNGDDEYTLADKGYDIVAPWYDKKNLTLFTRVKGDFNVNVSFSDELAGITDVFFDGEEGETEYFTLQGVKVATENLETGFYIARRGNKTIKVYIQK